MTDDALVDDVDGTQLLAFGRGRAVLRPCHLVADVEHHARQDVIALLSHVEHDVVGESRCQQFYFL